MAELGLDPRPARLPGQPPFLLTEEQGSTQGGHSQHVQGVFSPSLLRPFLESVRSQVPCTGKALTSCP